MSRIRTNPIDDEAAPVAAYHPKSAKELSNLRRALRWALTVLPLGGVVWASFLPLQTWMQQALILVALIWFYVFYLLDTFFMGG